MAGCAGAAGQPGTGPAAGPDEGGTAAVFGQGLGDPLWQRVPAPERRTLGALGLALDLAATDPERLALALAAFGRFEAPSAPADLVLELLAPPAGGPGPGAPAAAAAAPPSHRERGPLYVATDGLGGLVVADLAAGRATAFIATLAEPARSRQVLVESPVWRLAAWRGLVSLHAAAVRVDGLCLVLRGPAGAGKTSLAVAAGLAGHTVLAEEGTWFDATGDRPLLRGAPWWAHLEPAAAARLGLPGPGPGQAGAAKCALDLEALGLRLAEQAPPGPLVLLAGPPGGRARWRPLGAGPARAGFEAATTAGEATQRPEAWARAREALLAEGSYRLVPGSPAASVAALAEIAAHARERRP